MAISEYHINYSQDEDRIYIFVRDDDGIEHAFGLTRRLFKKLWPALGETIQAMSETGRKAAAHLKKEVLSIELEGAVTEAKESGTLSDKPLPEVAQRLVYLTKVVQIKDAETGGKVLTLSDGAKVISIGLSYERLLVICEALKSVVGNSDWDLRLTHPWEEPGPPEQAGPVTASSSDDSPTRH